MCTWATCPHHPDLISCIWPLTCTETIKNGDKIKNFNELPTPSTSDGHNRIRLWICKTYQCDLEAQLKCLHYKCTP